MSRCKEPARPSKTTGRTPIIASQLSKLRKDSNAAGQLSKDWKNSKVRRSTFKRPAEFQSTPAII